MGYMRRPVFLDSTDLNDLRALNHEVENSHNLIVLLTPGVLRRPWSLMEIVTAWKSDVRIVPVEIQRPGLTFQYPDEDFYSALTRGEILSPADFRLLNEWGVEPNDVVAAVRNVFCKIAVPFSPSKSTNIWR